MPKPKAKHSRAPQQNQVACRELILGDGKAARKKALRDYEKAKRDLEKAREEIDRFNSKDKPAFTHWLHRTLGKELTELRELARQYHEMAALIDQVEEISFVEGISPVKAYGLLMHQRAHPEQEAPPIAGKEKDNAAGEEALRGDDDFPPDDEPFTNAEAEEFERAFTEHFGMKPPPGLFPPGFGAEPAADPRLKQLYRILVRKLHPDCQKEMTPEKLEWWHEVQEAYEQGDVARMEVILNLCEIREGSNFALGSISMIQRIIAQFKSSLREARRELGNCRHEPAWNFSQSPEHQRIEGQIRSEMATECEQLRRMINEATEMLKLWEREAARAPTGKPRRSGRRHKGNFADDLFGF